SAVEVFEGRFVPTLAAGDAAVGGLYVAAGDEIVGSAQRGLGFLQQTKGFVEFALLERQPAFQHLYDGGHRRVAEVERETSALGGEAEGIIVAADMAKAS